MKSVPHVKHFETEVKSLLTSNTSLRLTSTCQDKSVAKPDTVSLKRRFFFCKICNNKKKATVLKCMNGKNSIPCIKSVMYSSDSNSTIRAQELASGAETHWQWL